MAGRRTERVAELMREALAHLLQRDVKDPRIGLVTLTSVRVSDDLRNARVFFSCVGGPEVRDRALAGLRSASGYLRSQLVRQLQLRYAPELTFVFDPSLENAERLSRLLRSSSNGEDPLDPEA